MMPGIERAASDGRRPRHAATVEQVLADRGLLGGLVRRGDDLVGPCPLHGGDNRGAFVVSRSKNVWYCFTRCGGGGDVIDLVRRLDGTGYRAALGYLQALAGTRQAGTTTISARGAGVSGGPLRTRARFRPFERRLRLDPTDPWLAGKGILPPTARRFEAGRYRGRGWLNGCIGVRLHDLHGRPLGYAGRRIEPREVARAGKWKMPRGLPKASLLYGWHRTTDRRHRGLVVVEGPWPVMRLAGLGLPAVALLGAHASARQTAVLAQVPRLVLMLDPDAAGRSGTRRLRAALGARTEVRVVTPGEGEDPDDLADAELAQLRELLLF